MTTEQTKCNRRSIRLWDYDYAQAGAYFVTVCTHNRECLFGEILDNEMCANHAGRPVSRVWENLPRRFPNLTLDLYVVMPNHFHGILVLKDWGVRRGESCIRPDAGDHKDRPYGTPPGSIGRIIQAFKSITTHLYIKGVREKDWTPFIKRLWQRNYYDHIIRNEQDLRDTREYILTNAARWEQDGGNPERTT